MSLPPPEPGQNRATAQGWEWEEGDPHVRIEVHHQNRKSRVLAEWPDAGLCLSGRVCVVPGRAVGDEARKVVRTRP